MPTLQTTAGDTLFFRDDDFTPPWDEPKITVLLHAEAESSEAWFGWMPRLSGRQRVIRPDLRGAGRSAATWDANEPVSLDRLAADVVALIDHLGADSVHLVAARHAAPIALRIAGTQPDRVATLVVCCGAANPAAALGPRAAAWVATIEREGVEGWGRSVIAERLGNDAEPALLDGWIGMLGQTDKDQLLTLLRSLPALDATGNLAAIRCPTLVISTDGSATNPIEATVAWQRQIGPSELLVLTGTGDHVAASHAKDAVTAVLDFYKKQARGGSKREKPEDRDREARRAKRQEQKEAQANVQDQRGTRRAR